MPKDYQEINEIVEEIFDTEYIGGKQPNLNKDYVHQALTTYGNARVEEIIKIADKEFALSCKDGRLELIWKRIKDSLLKS